MNIELNRMACRQVYHRCNGYDTVKSRLGLSRLLSSACIAVRESNRHPPFRGAAKRLADDALHSMAHS